MVVAVVVEEMVQVKLLVVLVEVEHQEVQQTPIHQLLQSFLAVLSPQAVEVEEVIITAHLLQVEGVVMVVPES
jgi:hypothetical protein